MQEISPSGVCNMVTWADGAAATLTTMSKVTGDYSSLFFFTVLLGSPGLTSPVCQIELREPNTQQRNRQQVRGLMPKVVPTGAESCRQALDAIVMGCPKHTAIRLKTTKPPIPVIVVLKLGQESSRSRLLLHSHTSTPRFRSPESGNPSR